MRHPIGLSRHDWLRINDPLWVSERSLEPPDDEDEYDPAQAEEYDEEEE